MPFLLLPGSEDALRASDWALWKLWLSGDAGASSKQLDTWTDKLSKPGEQQMLFGPMSLEGLKLLFGCRCCHSTSVHKQCLCMCLHGHVRLYCCPH